MAPSPHHGHHGHSWHHHHHHRHHTFSRPAITFSSSINRNPWRQRSRRNVVFLDDSTDFTAMIREENATAIPCPPAESNYPCQWAKLCWISLTIIITVTILLWTLAHGMALVGVSTMTFGKFDFEENTNFTKTIDPNLDNAHVSSRMSPFLKKMMLLRIVIGCIHFTSALIYWTITLNFVREQSKLRTCKVPVEVMYLLSFVLSWGISLWLIVRMLPDFQNFDKLNTTALALIILTAFETVGALVFGLRDACAYTCNQDGWSGVGTAYTTI